MTLRIDSQGNRQPGCNGRHLSIFAMPKAFVGHVAVIQKNAIRSWARLDPAPEILLFGDEPGIREMAEEVGARYVPQIDRNEFGTPLVNKLFEAAEAHASHEVLAYVNADMILFQDFSDGVQKVRMQRSQFLLIGQRWDIPVLEEIDFRQPCWQRSLQEQMVEHAMLHAECGLDYFVFPKGLYREIPPFAIGRTAWDNWLVMAPHTYGAAVVDGTEFITAVHQDHDYGHVAGGRQEAWKGVEAARNRELAGTSENTGRTSGATWILNREGVLVGTPPRQPQHLTAAYRAARVDWLLRQAEWLMAAGRRDLAACKQEESLGHQEVLIAAKQSSRASLDSVEGARLVERYATTCVCLAQCQNQMGQYEQAVASYSRLLENRRLSIPEPLREKLAQQRDACARQIRPDHPSATPSASLPCRDAAACVETRPDGNRSVDVAAGSPAGSRPKVTVIAACHDAERHLAECLDSILRQTLVEWELFLLDDGSTDGTRRIIADYAARDARIRPFYFDDSTGPYVRRNFAIRQARAPFISIQDADDIMVPQKLERLVEAIVADQRLGVVGSFYRTFLDEFTGIEHTEAAILPTTQEQMLEVYRTQCIWDYLWHGSALVRRDLFDTIGLYDENPFGADSFWLAKAIEYAHRTGRVRLGTIPESLTLRRVHADSQTGLLPTMDPRSRRVAYAQYCLERLQAAVGRAERDPGVDLAHELRECTCSDFLERRGDQAIEGEKRPADDQAIDDLLQRALERLRERRYVSCVRTLRWLEIMDPAVAVRVANFDLIHAMALLGLGHTKRGRDCLHREMVNHDNSMARQLHEEIFERGIAIDVSQWYTERADVITPRIDRALWPKASPKAHLAVAMTPAGPPEVTVVTACRNAERFLAECMDSILSQTLGEWELFLLDDSSTDDTRRIMSEYARRDGRIQVHRFDDNRGPYVRRNFAIERAAADFIVVHDADDLMEPTKLETLVNAIRTDDRLAMVGSDYRTFLDRYRGPQCSEHNRLPRANEEILARFRSWQHGMSHGSAIIRKALFAEIGLYDENPFAADSFWSAKLALYAEAGKPVCVKNVPECLTLIRMHGTNSTRLVSTLDPRSRRIRYRQYCMSKLEGVRDRLRLCPGVDIGCELRRCTCGDFLTRFKAQIITWESEPLDDRVVPEYLRLAVDLFNGGCYVSCTGMLDDVEALTPTVADRVEGFDLLRALALYALRMEPEARLCLEREIDRHGSPAARQFVKDAFASARPVDVVAWCRQHDGRFPIGLAEARTRTPQPTSASIGAR